MMTGYEAAKLWCAAKAHYKSDYDILKYNWSFNMSEETFRLRRDRFTFERLAREFTEPQFKAACGYLLYVNPKSVCKQLINNDGVKLALSRFEDLYFNFKYDYGTYMKSPQSPNEICDMLIEKQIAPESAAILYDLYEGERKSYFEKSKIAIVNRIPKYSAFVAYDKAKVGEIIKSYQTRS